MRRSVPFVLLMLVACAGSPDWVNPGVPKEHWSRDLTACRRDADDVLGVTDYYQPDDRSTLPNALMDRADTRKRFDAYVGSCMKGKGYRQAK